MQCKQQQPSLTILNLDIFDDKVETKSKHGALLPNSIRALFCGPSGCGKTNALLSLIFNENGIKFENVYVYSKSLYQPKYELLKKVLSKVKGIEYFPYKDNDDVIPISEAKNNSLFIFDDVLCDKQDKIREYYSMCRHKDIDAAYLGQTYSKIPKQLIRDNCNVIVLFKQDDINLKHVFYEHISPDMTFDRFKSLCADCWKDKFECFIIAKDFQCTNGRYRKGFDKYISL